MVMLPGLGNGPHNPEMLWNRERPREAPGGTLYHSGTGKTVSHPVYVLTPDNFERAEQAIALCMARGLMGPGRS